MPNTFTQCHVHVVFSTKQRQPTIREEIQPRLWAYMAGICQSHGMIPVEIGGIENHVHLLLHLPPALALAKAVLLIKSNSSRWMHGMHRGFAWQDGYGAFNVSASNVESVARYVRNQKQHHRRMTFEDEYIILLKKHGVAYQLKYVFG